MIDRDVGLAQRFADRGVLLTGDGSITAALVPRLEAIGCTVRAVPSVAAAVERVPASFEAAIVSLQALPDDPTRVGSAIFEIVALLRHDPQLRHVIVVAPAFDGRVVGTCTAALARTLAIYATAHTADVDIRINVLCVPPRPGHETITRTNDVIVVLLSGLLDAVRGQTLLIDAARPEVLG